MSCEHERISIREGVARMLPRFVRCCLVLQRDCFLMPLMHFSLNDAFWPYSRVDFGHAHDASQTSRTSLLMLEVALTVGPKTAES